ncbi:myelin protein zero-like protein 2 [Protopterus annectens]|uniref:myelin protein zero-like protein 2 n=1 Tax=Protopterus annectens TaxID=7888 RepID=UPI001CF9AAF9|nr:myelin protein zero-like protein 2 [Protopterus annectens]
MYGIIFVFAFLIGTPLLGVVQITAIEVFTSKEVEAVNGTDVKLKCTFSTSAPIGNKVTVTWHFRPQGGKADETVLYYNNEPYPPVSGRFKGRVIWSGNLAGKDASITIRDLQHTDNGTFTCQVQNPPDVHGIVGEVKLSVVDKVRFSEIHLLAIVIGGAIGLIILIVLLVTCIKLCCRRKSQDSWDGVEYHDCNKMQEVNVVKKNSEQTASLESYS